MGSIFCPSRAIVCSSRGCSYCLHESYSTLCSGIRCGSNDIRSVEELIPESHRGKNGDIATMGVC